MIIIETCEIGDCVVLCRDPGRVSGQTRVSIAESYLHCGVICVISEHYCCSNGIVEVTALLYCRLLRSAVLMSASRLIDAFKDGDKRLAQRLFDWNRPGDVWYELTTFQSFLYKESVEKVSLLHLAAYWGWKDFTERLVTSRSDAIKDSKGNIPLHYAAYNGHLDLVEYFITRGCNPIAGNWEHLQNYSTSPRL